jgi:aldehyde dehydrogenase (NAD+)
VKSKSGETLTVTNPATEETVTKDVQVAGPEDIDAAVSAAKAAFKGPWKKFTGAQRAACMNKFADLIEENMDELARLESIAMGQPVGVAKVFIGLCVPGWRCEEIHNHNVHY